MDIVKILETIFLYHVYWLPSVAITSIPFYYFTRKLREVREKKPSYLLIFFMAWLMLGLPSSIFGKELLEKYMILNCFLALGISLAIVTLSIKKK